MRMIVYAAILFSLAGCACPSQPKVLRADTINISPTHGAAAPVTNCPCEGAHAK